MPPPAAVPPAGAGGVGSSGGAAVGVRPTPGGSGGADRGSSSEAGHAVCARASDAVAACGVVAIAGVDGDPRAMVGASAGAAGASPPSGRLVTGVEGVAAIAALDGLPLRGCLSEFVQKWGWGPLPQGTQQLLGDILHTLYTLGLQYTLQEEHTSEDAPSPDGEGAHRITLKIHFLGGSGSTPTREPGHS